MVFPLCYRPPQEAFDFLESKGHVNIQMECHKVDRVTEASENGKVEWPVTVAEECLMHPTRPASTAKATALNFGGDLDTTQFSDSHDHPLGRVKLVPGCRLDGQNILPNKFAIFLEKSIRVQKGDIVALTNEAE